MKQYEKIPIQNPKKSLFDLSHEHKLSMGFGDLVPIICQEVIPGDNFKLSYEALVKLQPTIAPIMHRINVHAHFFFVPNRLIWKDWEDFITGGPDGDLAPNHPKFVYNGVDIYGNPNFSVNSLADYLGIPVERIQNTANAVTPFSQLPFRAYQLIFNEYYRDQTLQDKVQIPLDSLNISADDAPILSIQKRNWEKDYFTSALPFAQRGEPVRLPLGETAPVTGKNMNVRVGAAQVVNGNIVTNASSQMSATTGASPGISIDGLTADLSEATAATVSDVRTAFAIQRYLEKMARGGSRYIEQILNFFGVKSSDARLQRPEFLGGGKLPIQIAEVIQTSQSADTEQGNMSGLGNAAGNITGFNRYFEEHGFVIGILSITPRTSYFQGFNRSWFKFDKFDYFWPQFAHIGEQPVFNKELYLSMDGTENDTFGYQPRYMEYRCNNDRVSGDFRTNLNYWHLARIFTTKPALNSAFVQCNPSDRIFAVSDPQFKKFLVMGYFNFTAIRPIPKYGEPI